MIDPDKEITILIKLDTQTYTGLHHPSRTVEFTVRFLQNPPACNASLSTFSVTFLFNTDEYCSLSNMQVNQHAKNISKVQIDNTIIDNSYDLDF